MGNYKTRLAELNLSPNELDENTMRHNTKADLTADNILECPKCAGVMVQRTISEVEIDECLRCHGIYLDIGELDLIVAETTFGPIPKRRSRQ